MTDQLARIVAKRMAPPEHPFLFMISGVQGDVLYALAHAQRTETAAEIARRTNRSKTQVQAVLNRFYKMGLIERTFYDCWSWNILKDSHPFTEHIVAMARQEFEERDLPGAIHALDAIDE